MIVNRKSQEQEQEDAKPRVTSVIPGAFQPRVPMGKPHGLWVEMPPVSGG